MILCHWLNSICSRAGRPNSCGDFSIPPTKRSWLLSLYPDHQIVTEHGDSQIVTEDTGLGFQRTRNVILLQIVTRPRSTDEKRDFYARLCRALKSECGVEPSDVIVSLVENSDADWSFGGGEAQFLTGALPNTRQR